MKSKMIELIPFIVWLAVIFFLGWLIVISQAHAAPADQTIYTAIPLERFGTRARVIPVLDNGRICHDTIYYEFDDNYAPTRLPEPGQPTPEPAWRQVFAVVRSCPEQAGQEPVTVGAREREAGR